MISASISAVSRRLEDGKDVECHRAGGDEVEPPEEVEEVVPALRPRSEDELDGEEQHEGEAVSYTHLTLPTIYSV